MRKIIILLTLFVLSLGIQFLRGSSAVKSLNSLLLPFIFSSFRTLSSGQDPAVSAVGGLVNNALSNAAASWGLRPTFSTTFFSDSYTTFTTLKACCTQLHTDALGTWSMLTDIKSTVSVDILSTWSILNSISTQQNTIVNCCNALQGAGSVISIVASTTLNSAGSYVLGANITGPITIAANDVTLDLQNKVISGGTNGIIVSSGVERVSITNGQLTSINGPGILLQSGCKSIQISKITCSQNGSVSMPYAISCQGSSTSKIQELYLHDLIIYNSLSGILCTFVDNSCIDHCRVAACATSAQCNGITLQGSAAVLCKSNKINNCAVMGCSSTTSQVSGIQLNYAQSTQCAHTVIAGLSGVTAAYGLYGFQTVGLTLNDINLEDISTPTATAVGLLLTGSLSTGIVGTTIEIVTIVSPTAYGMQCTTNLLDGAFDALYCSNIQGSTRAAGFYLDAPSLLVRRSTANRIISNTLAEGYIVTSNAPQSIVDTSQALSITGTGASSVATGIHVQANNSVLQGCEINGVLAPTAQGFWLDSTATNVALENSITTSCLGNGVLIGGTQALCYNVVSQNNTLNGYSVSGSTASLINCIANQNGVNGIYITGANAVLQGCQVFRSVTGILNSGSNALIAQSFAARNSTNYSGVSNTGLLGALSLVAGGNLAA